MPNYQSRHILPVRDPVTYSKPPAPPVGVGAWLNDTISQPYFPAVDITPYAITPKNPGTYFKPPPPVTFSVSTIAQPISILQIQNLPHIKPVSTYFTPPVPVASWLTKTIAQPYILPYNEFLYGVSPVTIFPLPITVNITFIRNYIQPYYALYSMRNYVWIPPIFKILLIRLLLGIGI